MSWTYSAVLELGSANTGLTLVAALFTGAGIATTSTTTYLAEKGVIGSYYAELILPDSHRGYVTFSSLGVIKAVKAIIPEVSVNIGSSIADATNAGTLPSTCGELSAVQGDTWTLSIIGLGSLVGRSKLWFTLKSDTAGADTASLAQIEESAGLLYINGAVAGTPGNGAIVVTDAAAGDLTVTLQPVESALIAVGAYYTYDVQIKVGTTITTLLTAAFTVTAGVTKATS